MQAIQQAAAELFAEQGYARTTTNKIAARAGVSVGSLYQYFPNKDSILNALLARHEAEVHAVLRSALRQLADPAQPLEGALRALLQQLAQVHQANPLLTRALSDEVLRQSPVVDKPHEHDRPYTDQVVAILAQRPDVRAGDHLAMALVLGQATAQLTRWLAHGAPAEVEQQRLLEQMAQLLLRFLRAD